MKSYLIPVIFLWSTCFSQDLKQGITEDPVFVGVVDGKSYYSGNQTQMNWFDAKHYCEENELELATIETAAEVAMLEEVNSPHFNGFYWTAGRDAVATLRRFSWDKTETEVGLLPYSHSVGPFACLQVHKGGAQLYYLSSEYTSTSGILCQTTAGN